MKEKKRRTSSQGTPGLWPGSSPATETGALRLICPSTVALRREAFGGMAFHRERGVTLEVDAEAYHFLCACLAPRPLPSPDHPAARLVPQLLRLGFLCPAEATPEPAKSAPDVRWSGDGFTLSAPETVHLTITARCNLHCPGCYVSRQPVGPELSTGELRRLIDQWAEMRVFQLAVGGGEPLLRDDLFEVLAYARQQGIVSNLTTNGTLLTPETAHRLGEAGVGQVNVSVNGPTANGDGNGRTATALRALRLLLSSSLAVGVNLLVTPALLPSLSDILSRLHALGVRQVTVLRPKPGYDPTWYAAHCLRCHDLIRLRQVMDAWRGKLHLEVGSALVCLMGDVQPGLLRRRAVHGCAAGRRICTVWPDGWVTPCSFLPHLNAGNAREKPFALIWREGWEELRDPSALPGGRCHGCPISHLCGGVRCLAWHERGNLSAGDAECPRFDIPHSLDGSFTATTMATSAMTTPTRLARMGAWNPKWS